MISEAKRKMKRRVCPRCDRRGLEVLEYNTKVLRCVGCGWTRTLKKGKPYGKES